METRSAVKRNSAGRKGVSNGNLFATINDAEYSMTPEELLLLKCGIEHFVVSSNQETSTSTASSSLSSAMHFPSYRTKDFSNKLRKSSALHISNSPHEQSLSKVSGGKLISRDNVSDLIFRGYHCLERMNADKKRVSDLKRRVKLYFSGSSPESFDTRKVRRESKNESENHGDIVGVDDLDINLEENDIREPLKETTDVPDPCVRPILLPPPGCLGFRHDPVKRYEIYRKNWESNPIPGEEKRLRLRWKIREYMLRREVPSLKVSDLMKPRPPNPEWTPRRYLD